MHNVSNSTFETSGHFYFLVRKKECPATVVLLQDSRFICVIIVNSIMIDIIPLFMCGSRLLSLRQDDTNLQPTASFLGYAVS